MEYVVQAFKVLKNLVHAEANARAQKTGFFVAFLTQRRFLYAIFPKGRSVIITNAPLGISLQISCSN